VRRLEVSLWPATARRQGGKNEKRKNKFGTG
jgi:hypothetical protein